MSTVAHSLLRSSLKSMLPFLPQPMQDSLRETHYLKKLRRATLADEPDLSVIELCVSPGDTVMDVGANFGLYTRFLSERVGPAGRVHAFEPLSVMGGILRRNLQVLAIENVVVNSCALSDRSGQAALHIPQFDNAAPNYYEASLLPVAGEPIVDEETVETISIDSYVEAQGLDSLSFLKIDVEGHELAVLAGGRETFRRFRPAVLLEVNAPLHEAGHGAAVLAMVQDLGYEVCVHEAGAIRPWQAGEVFVNYLLRRRRSG